MSMRRSARRAALFAPLAAALAFAPAAIAAPERTGEQQLAEMLEGRVAGKPQSCISTFNGDYLQIVDKTAVVYDSGKTIWVSRPNQPDRLDEDDILVVERSGGQLCKLDRITTVDRLNRTLTGIVFLNDFVPYTKAGG